ncbi:MAG: hypothetical protein IJW49_04885 [Clostridia bacterium]|nr:hypothetical protein [Clostridia bacterium]
MNSKIQIKNKLTLNNIIILLLVCMATMNVINRYFYFIFIAVGWFCLKPNRKIVIDGIACFSLILLAVSWLMFSPEDALEGFGILKPFTYFLCYVLGTSLLNDDRNHSNQSVSYYLFYFLLAVIALGPFIHYLLNWSINASVVNDRNTRDFWTNSVMSATGQASLGCIPLAVAAACIFSDTSKKLKLASWISIVLVLGYNLILSGRTLFVLALIALVAAFLFRFMTKKRGKLHLLVIFIVIAIFLVVLYQSDIFGIKTYVEDSPIYDRFFGKSSSIDLDEDARLDNKLYFIENMLDYPFGGGHLQDQTGYAHDLYLDTYDQAGIFAFIAVVVFMLNSLKHFVKCISNKEFPFVFRQLVFCTYLILYIEFLVEPVLVGMPWMFASFCLLDGYVGRLLKHSQYVKRWRANTGGNA